MTRKRKKGIKAISPSPLLSLSHKGRGKYGIKG